MNIKRFKIFAVFFACCFLYSSGSLLAAVNTNHKRSTKPALILADVASRGAREVANEIYSDSEKFYFVLRQIATGTELWLKVAVALHPSSDAGMSEMLSLSIGEALENSPGNVFRLALPEFQQHIICGGPDVDDKRYDSYMHAVEAIKRRQNKVATLADPEVRKLSRQCIRMLEESKDGLAKFYGVQKR